MARRDSFPAEWIAGWNAHDLEAIVGHYADDIVYRSPLVESVLGIDGGRLSGRDAVRDYFAASLRRYPDLRFTLFDAFWGLDSVVLRYRSVNDLIAAEYFAFNPAGEITEVRAHYAAAPVSDGS